MMDRKAFAEQLLSVDIPSNLSLEEQQERLNELIKIAHNILPSRLYRYRTCSELSIGAFDKDELWASTPECMNDGFDTRVFIDSKGVKEQYKRIFLNNIDKTTIINSIPDITGFPQQLVQGREEIQKLSEEKISKGVSALDEWIMNDAEQALLQINTVGQKTVKICCFSENIYSPAMWGLYASDESGFALEYDFSQTPYAQSPKDGYSRECALSR